MTGIFLGPRYVAGSVAPGTVALGDAEHVSLNNARWQLGSDGYTYFNRFLGGPPGPAWINPRQGMEQFEILVSLAALSDPLDLDPGLDTWISCATSPEWGYVGTSAGGSAGYAAGTLNVQIRRASDLVVVDTAAIYIEKMGSTGDPGGGGGTGYL